ncbi:SprT-like domain-containing protein, partial [Nocardioides sp.]|uniref:SprT-like domain-containing protein n=1 Tax=Nocardioides sp. TaxID=35761 RepID=UPI0035631AFF
TETTQENDVHLTDAARLGRTLLDEHGLTDWTLVFDRAKRRAGICRPGLKQIGLSGPLTELHPESEVRDTILHEIAHALVGPGHGHDQVWQAKARRIGCTGLRCTAPDLPKIEGDWVGRCSAGHQVTRHRRPTRPAACAQCSRRFEVAHLLTWTYCGFAVPMSKGYDEHLQRLLAAQSAQSAPSRHTARVGDRLRVLAQGRYHGVVGRLVKVGRTRHHLQVGRTVLTVPFGMVEPVGEEHRDR